jgi:hypothetical protein
MKYIPWITWFLGFSIIFFTFMFNHLAAFSRHPFNFVFITLLSSLSFAGLAIYATKILKNDRMTFFQKNANFSGIGGGFVVTVGYAIWSFSSPMDGAISPATIFWMLSVVTTLIGFILGAFVYVVIAGEWGDVARFLDYF